MPHKRNPVVSERVSGLARVLRGYAQVALEDMPLWHERDISHSSAERVILPDATGLLHFMLSDMAWVMEGLHVDPDRMLANLESTGGLFFSQKVLTALVDHGMAARRRVQGGAASRQRHLGARAAVPGADVGGDRRRRRPVRGGVRRPCSWCSRTWRTWAASSSGSRSSRWRRREPGRGPARAREGARRLRGGRRPPADRRDRPDQRVRRGAAHADPRQGPRAHRAVALLVRRGRATSWATIW